MSSKILLFSSILLLFFLGNSVAAQTQKFEKVNVVNKLSFEANSDSVWTYLSNLGNLQNLIPSTIKTSILEGEGVGSVVTLTLQNGGKVEEEVVKLNNRKKQICYKMIETPLPIRDYMGCFKVRRLKNKQVEVIFSAGFSVQENNRLERIEVFHNLQLELLNNLKNITHGK